MYDDQFNQLCCVAAFQGAGFGVAGGLPRPDPGVDIYISTCLFIYMLSRRACLARWECLGPGTPWPRCARACTRCPSCSRPCSSWSQGSGRSSGSSSRPQHVIILTTSAPRYLLSLHMVERSGGCVVSEEVTYLNPELHRIATYNTSKQNI